MSDQAQDSRASHLRTSNPPSQTHFVRICGDPENCRSHEDGSNHYLACLAANEPDIGARRFTDVTFTDKDVKRMSGLRWCSNCEITADEKKLFACAACGNTPHRVFYCSRECQKANWKEHKPFCAVVRAECSNAHLRMITPEQTIESNWAKIVRSNTTVFNWAAGQAFRCNPQYDPTKTVLHISLGSVDKGPVKLPLCPISFEFRPRSENSRGDNIKPDRPRHNLGYYSFDRPDSSKVGFTISIQPDDCGSNVTGPDAVIPQWSYILTQSLESCMTDYIRARLRFLTLIIIVKSNEAGAPLKSFRTPRINHVLNMNFDVYLLWRELASRIISTNLPASVLFNGDYKPKIKNGGLQFCARSE